MKDLHELGVWQKAHQLTLAIYQITATFPRARIVWADQSTATIQFLDPGQPRRGMRKKWRRRRIRARAVVWSKEGKIQWAKRSADFSFLLRKGPVEESTFAPGNTSLKYPLPGSRYLLLAVPVSMSRRAMRFFIRVARRNRQIAVAQHNRPAGSSPAYPGWTAEDIG
jgi:hypothetical protein